MYGISVSRIQYFVFMHTVVLWGFLRAALGDNGVSHAQVIVPGVSREK